MKIKKLATFLATFAVSAAAVAGLAACGDGGNDGGETVGLSTKAWNNFTHTYTDGTGASVDLSYSLYVPSTYDGKNEFPLITYIPDATISNVAGTKTAQCPANWKKYDNACILVLTSDNLGSDPADTTTQGGQIVPIIDKLVEDYKIDANRLYLTGQSKGGIYDFALNDAFPEKFAATVYVSCQMGGEVHDEQYDRIFANARWANQKFIYIASKLDQKAPPAFEEMRDYFATNNISYGYLTDLDHVDLTATSAEIKTELDKGYSQNIFQYKQVADGSGAQEHMQGFQYGYKVESIYNWLLAQSK